MIPVKKEHSALYKEFKQYEKCIFCHVGTNTWHEETNTPVCPECAKRFSTEDIAKSKGKAPIVWQPQSPVIRGDVSKHPELRLVGKSRIAEKHLAEWNTGIYGPFARPYDANPRILATYLVSYAKEGVWTDENDKPFFHSETIELDSTTVPFDKQMELFNASLDAKLGVGQWETDEYFGAQVVISGFYIEKGHFSGIEGEYSFLQGFGDYIFHCHSLSSVESFLESKIFAIDNLAILPYFQMAKEMMEKGYTGYVRPIASSGGTNKIYQP